MKQAWLVLLDTTLGALTADEKDISQLQQRGTDLEGVEIIVEIIKA